MTGMTRSKTLSFENQREMLVEIGSRGHLRNINLTMFITKRKRSEGQFLAQTRMIKREQYSLMN